MTTATEQQVIDGVKNYMAGLMAAMTYTDRKYSEEHLNERRANLIAETDRRAFQAIENQRTRLERKHAGNEAALDRKQLVAERQDAVRMSWDRLEPVLDAGKRLESLLLTTDYEETLALWWHLPRYWEARQISEGKEPYPSEIESFKAELDELCFDRLQKLDDVPKEIKGAIAAYQGTQAELDAVNTWSEAVKILRNGREIAMPVANALYTIDAETFHEFVDAHGKLERIRLSTHGALDLARQKLRETDNELAVDYIPGH